MSDRASRNRVICAQRTVPAGWVVIGEYHNPACPGDGNNALIIKQPGRREVVSKYWPIPEGYTTVRGTSSEHCAGDGENAWLIEKEPR